MQSRDEDFGFDFNSIKVRLNPPSYCRCSSYIRFQFHKGTIKPAGVLAVLLALSNFNSIKVRLNLATMKHILKKGFDFNSIKVRLNLLNKGGDYKKEDISIP